MLSLACHDTQYIQWYMPNTPGSLRQTLTLPWSLEAQVLQIAIPFSIIYPLKNSVCIFVGSIVVIYLKGYNRHVSLVNAVDCDSYCEISLTFTRNLQIHEPNARERTLGVIICVV